MKLNIKTLCSVGALLLCSESVLANDVECFKSNESSVHIGHRVVSEKDLSYLSENADKLRCVTLWNNGLTKFPEEIKRLKCVTELSIGNNEVEEIPSWIGNMKSLKHLHLHHNKLNNLPSEIENLELKHICFNDNNIQGIPDEVLFIGTLDFLNQTKYYELSRQGINEVREERIKGYDERIRNVKNFLDQREKERSDLQKQMESLKDKEQSLKKNGESKRQRRFVKRDINKMSKAMALFKKTDADLLAKKESFENILDKLRKAQQKSEEIGRRAGWH